MRTATRTDKSMPRNFAGACVASTGASWVVKPNTSAGTGKQLSASRASRATAWARAMSLHCPAPRSARKASLRGAQRVHLQMRPMHAVVVDGVARDANLGAQRVAGVAVDVEVGKAAARNVHTDAVAGLEEVGGGLEGDR